MPALIPCRFGMLLPGYRGAVLAQAVLGSICQKYSIKRTVGPIGKGQGIAGAQGQDEITAGLCCR